MLKAHNKNEIMIYRGAPSPIYIKTLVSAAMLESGFFISGAGSRLGNPARQISIWPRIWSLPDSEPQTNRGRTGLSMPMLRHGGYGATIR